MSNLIMPDSFREHIRFNDATSEVTYISVGRHGHDDWKLLENTEKLTDKEYFKRKLSNKIRLHPNSDK